MRRSASSSSYDVEESLRNGNVSHSTSNTCGNIDILNVPFDPFGDYEQSGYLRNSVGEKDLEVVHRLEHAAFAANVEIVLKTLAGRPQLGYQDLLRANRMLFKELYPWAGKDRKLLAPDLDISRAGVRDMFAHPDDVRRGVEYAISEATTENLQRRPGYIFGLLAHAHPFLDTNGRTLLTFHTEMMRRAGSYIAWHRVDKGEFLANLTQELIQPGYALDKLLAPYLLQGELPIQPRAAIITSATAPRSR